MSKERDYSKRVADDFVTTRKVCNTCAAAIVLHVPNAGRRTRLAPDLRRCYICAERTFRESERDRTPHQRMRVFNSDGTPNAYRRNMQ